MSGRYASQRLALLLFVQISHSDVPGTVKSALSERRGHEEREGKTENPQGCEHPVDYVSLTGNIAEA